MKTRYILETVQEFKLVATPQPRDDALPVSASLPRLSGKLEVRMIPVHGGPCYHMVELINDPNFNFSIPFKDFFIQTCRMADIEVFAHDNIPN